MAVDVKLIRTTGKAHKLLSIDYRDSKGVVSRRKVEPYEIKNNVYFFGYDIEKDSIRKFKIHSILRAEATNISFTPRWLIKL